MEGTYTNESNPSSAATSLLPRVPDHHPRTAWSTGLVGLALFAMALVLLMSAAGCQDRTSLVPNSDPALRKTKTEFAADARARHPYHAEAPKAGVAQGAAAVDYELNRLQIANFTGEDWNNIELWVNRQWVVFVPKVPANAERAKTIDFSMLYNEVGMPFPDANRGDTSVVNKVEIYRDGRMYELAAIETE
jgi:hypothetical protein